MRPVVLVCETNDRELPWYAEARREIAYFLFHIVLSAHRVSSTMLVISHDDNGQEVIVKVGHASASRKKTAKAEAAALGYQWLRSNYPTIDLSNV